MPFIVDSPANPIDLHVRRKFAELIPKLTSQFIAFTISSEREGFLTPLETAMQGKPIQYLTLFQKDRRNWKASPRMSNTCVKAWMACVSLGEIFTVNSM